MPKISLAKTHSYDPISGYFRRKDHFVHSEMMQKYNLEALATRMMGRYNLSTIDEYISDPQDNLEFKRVAIALELWEDTPGAKLTTKEEVFKRLLLEGNKYLSSLKDEWELGIRASHNLPVMGRTFDYKRVEHYNALPVIDHLINWVEDPEDYLLMSNKPSFNEDTLEVFREYVYDLLPDDIHIPNDAEIWSQTKVSVSWDDSEGKVVPFWKARLSPRAHEFSKVFRGRRCIVPVSAGNIRDTVVTPIDVYNSVNWCDKVILGILDGCPESLITSSASLNQERLKRAKHLYGGSFYLRDIKKCGLTFPRELFHIIQECLSEKYPDRDFSRFDIYRKFTVYKDNKPIQTNTGYCLGMANNLVTLCQIVINRMLIGRLPPSWETTYYCGNDDSLFFIKGYDHNTEDIALAEIEDDIILQDLGIIKHNVKSFWSIYPIIFEEYGKDSFHSKDSRFAMALAPCFLVEDIKTSKRICNSLSDFLKEITWKEKHKPIRKLANWWGYDYYPEEASKDYLFGGWISQSSGGCSTVLREIMDAPEEDIPWMHLAYRKVMAYENAIIPYETDDPDSTNMAHLGAALGIRWIAPDIELPETLPTTSLKLTSEAYKRFYNKVFKLSRRPYQVFEQAERRVRKVRHPGEILKEEFIKIVADSVHSPMAIPESFVTSTTFLWNEEEDYAISPFYYHNRIAGYLEGLRQDNLILAPPIHQFRRNKSSLIEDHIAPIDCEVKGYYLNDTGKVPEGSYQYSRRPGIPLTEYYKKYDVLPKTLKRFKKDFDHPPERIKKFSPRNEREAILILEIEDEERLEIVLEELRSEQEQLQTQAYVETSTQVEVHNHYDNILEGWDPSYTIFTQLAENCQLCKLYYVFWRYRILKEHDTNQEKRAQYERDYLSIVETIKSFINSKCPDKIEDVLSLVGGSDFFDDSDDGSFGGGMFD